MLKVELDDVRVDQTLTFYREGSILAGSIKAGAHRLDAHIAIDSPEPRERLLELIRIAKESCFTHGALANPVDVGTTLTLNGEPQA
jgi:organic hydroperoxide reductase OsmC/OhrA